MNTTTNFLEFEKISEERPTQQKGLKQGSKKRKLVVTGIVLTCLIVAGLAYNKISKSNNHKGLADPDDQYEPTDTLINFIGADDGFPGSPNAWDWSNLKNLSEAQGDQDESVDIIFGTIVPRNTYESKKSTEELKKLFTDQYIVCFLTENEKNPSKSISCSNQWRVVERGRVVALFSVVLKNHKVDRDSTLFYTRVMIFNQRLDGFGDTIDKLYNSEKAPAVQFSSKPFSILKSSGSKIGENDLKFEFFGKYDTSKPNFKLELEAKWKFKTLKDWKNEDVNVFAMDNAAIIGK